MSIRCSYYLLKNLSFFAFSFCFFSAALYSHDGHHPSNPADLNIIHWIGSFHLILLHFPIALLIMTAIAEGFLWYSQKPIYEHAARFMLLAAAFTIIPTALLGWAFSYGATSEGVDYSLLWWHSLYGSLTTGFVVLSTYLREYYQSINPEIYYLSLAFAFIGILLTGYYGGVMSLGPFYFLPF